MDPKVTVVIPAYNAQRCLRETMETVFAQTYQNLEIICINDASTDGTQALLEELAREDDRLIYKTIEHKGNGAANARNTGLQMATGDYIIFLDADDLFDSELVSKLLCRAELFDADITYCDAQVYMEDTGAVLNPDYLLKKQYLVKECFSWRDASEYLFSFGSLSAWTQLYRLDFLRKNEIQFQSYFYCDDISFVQTALCTADRITWIPDRLIKWRKTHAESQTTNRGKYPLVLLQCFRDLSVSLKDNPGFIAAKHSWDCRAADTVSFFFSALKTYDTAEIFYDAFMGEFREVFKFDTHELNYYDNIRVRTWMDSIFTYSKNEFLARHNIYRFPIEGIEQNARVVLYGAGKRGRAFFCDNLYSGQLNIVAWADQKADTLGFPICRPEELLNVEFDYVLITVEKSELRRTIKESLVQLGIDEKKILAD